MLVNQSKTTLHFDFSLNLETKIFPWQFLYLSPFIRYRLGSTASQIAELRIVAASRAVPMRRRSPFLVSLKIFSVNIFAVAANNSKKVME